MQGRRASEGGVTARWVIEREGRTVLETRFGAGLTRVGADPSNDVVLEGEGMPPLAAVVTFEDDGRFHVRTMNSEGETLLQGPVSSDPIEIGDYILRFVAETHAAVQGSTRRIEADSGEVAPLILELDGSATEISPGSKVSVGRDDTNDLHLPFDVVSGFHARIESSGAGWQILDLGSTNGTFLDGVRISKAVLPDAGLLRLGDFEVPFSTRIKAGEVEQEGYYGIVGRSPAIRAVFKQIEVVAALDEPVLVWGETGTGKELVASALHKASPRSKLSLVARNCGAIPESLADAELFGSNRGAFSGAIDKMGVFEGAKGGTVFLDEVGELPVQVQPKLLRTLQERRVKRLGAVDEKAVDFRLIAATHRDLMKMVEKKQFREDLFHRISVFTIRVPPLRERREDIPLLVRHLLGGAAHITDAALNYLAQHSWPGNVRELRNTLIRASAFRPGGEIGVSDIKFQSAHARPSSASVPLPETPSPKRGGRGSLSNDQTEELTRRVWEEEGRSVSRAAVKLGIAKSTMHRRKEYYRLPERTQ